MFNTHAIKNIDRLSWEDKEAKTSDFCSVVA